MTTLHIIVQKRSQASVDGPQVVWNGCTFTSLSISAPLVELLRLSFEDAGALLSKLPGCYFEPDGSFAWVRSGEAPWRLEGCLYDRDDRLVYLELRGDGPADAVRQILSLLAPEEELAVQLPQQGFWLKGGDFLAGLEQRATAASSSASID